MTYNLTAMQNASDLMELAQGTNEILGGYFFGMFVLFAVWIVMFFALKSKGYVGAACAAVSSWIIFFIALMLRAMDLIGNHHMWAVVLLAVACIFLLFMEGNPD